MSPALGVVLFLGALVFLRREMNRMFAEEKARSRSPFKEKLLRPPGESLRLKIDDIMETGMILSAAMVGPSLVIMAVKTQSWQVNLGIWSLVAVIGYGAAYRWDETMGFSASLCALAVSSLRRRSAGCLA